MILNYLITLNKRSFDKKIYKFELLILWLLLIFRYGQGSDYFSYMDIFYSMDSLDKAIFNPEHVHGEIGYRFLCYMMKGNFQLFVALLATYSILMFKRFIEKYSSNYCLSLLLFYPTIYLSYCFSSLRQIIVLSTFVGIMLELLLNKKYINYYILCIILSLFHTSALMLIIVPVVFKLSLRNMYVYAGIISIAFLILYNTGFGKDIMANIPIIGAGIKYYYNNDASLMALLERVFMLILVSILYLTNPNKLNCKVTMALYVFGTGMYIALSSSALTASRMTVYFKILEVVIIPVLLEKKSCLRQLIILFIVLFVIFMTCKNLSSYIEQGKYHNNVHFWNYPYISIFNKDKIWEYRDKTIYWSHIISELNQY